MATALLHIDFADKSWFPGETMEIELEPEEHVFRRAGLGNEVRGVFVTIRGRRAMLLRKASETFRWSPGCAVGIVVPRDGAWPDGQFELDQLHLEDVGRAVVEIAGE
jgi:hypothetical protein